MSPFTPGPQSGLHRKSLRGHGTERPRRSLWQRFRLHRFSSRLLQGGLAIAAVATTTLTDTAQAAPGLVIDLASGNVIYQSEATRPWYPASLTKLMTLYVALQAVRDHRIGFDTPLVVSARAHAMPPSKMGFKPGTQVTLGNALKMLMVKSANDIAITVAEGIAGSVEAFAEDMNAQAADLGLRQSHFVNPNGLHNEQHYSSARDMALLARALYLRFPQYASLYNIGALRLGNQIIQNHNNLLGRYPGVDGMKTGYTCTAGFNIVASAEQGGRRVIAVVLGSPNVETRTIKAAALFDRAFSNIDHAFVTLDNLPVPPDMLPSPYDVCRNRAQVMAEANAEIDTLMTPLQAGAFTPQPERAFLFDADALGRAVPVASRITLVPRPVFDPQPVSVGPVAGYSGPVAQARAPHTPIGSAPLPELASAYAPKTAARPLPLMPDLDAVPLKQTQTPVKPAVVLKPAPVAHRMAHHAPVSPPPAHVAATVKPPVVKAKVVSVKPVALLKTAAPLPPKTAEKPKMAGKPAAKVSAKTATTEKTAVH